MRRSVCVRFAESLLGAFGLCWLFLEAYYGLTPSESDRLAFRYFAGICTIVGVAWFFVDGLLISGFLKRCIEITSNAFDTPIKVFFGDLCDQDGCKVVSVNEFFDSRVDGKHVSPNSLHGAMLMRHWGGNVADWDHQVSEDLVGVNPVAVIERPSLGKRQRYGIGTTAKTSTHGQDFLCVALTHTNIDTLQASASSDDLHLALRQLLAKARTSCNGDPLNIPLLGSGLSRTGIKPNILADLILLAIVEESKKEKITSEIRIVIPRSHRNRVDLTTIQKDWS